MGLLGLFSPRAAAKFVGIEARSTLGISEVRATYGGLFIGLGLSILLFPQAEAYFVGSFCWFGAAAARIASLVVDGSRSIQNLAGVVLESAFGGALLCGALDQ